MRRGGKTVAEGRGVWHSGDMKSMWTFSGAGWRWAVAACAAAGLLWGAAGEAQAGRPDRGDFGNIFGGMGSDDVKLQYSDDDPDSYSNIFSNAKMSGTLTYRTLNITSNTELECKLAKRKDKGH